MLLLRCKFPQHSHHITSVELPQKMVLLQLDLGAFRAEGSSRHKGCGVATFRPPSEVSEWWLLMCLLHKLTMGFAVIGATCPEGSAVLR